MITAQNIADVIKLAVGKGTGTVQGRILVALQREIQRRLWGSGCAWKLAIEMEPYYRKYGLTIEDVNAIYMTEASRLPIKGTFNVGITKIRR